MASKLFLMMAVVVLVAAAPPLAATADYNRPPPRQMLRLPLHSESEPPSSPQQVSQFPTLQHCLLICRLLYKIMNSGPHLLSRS